MWKLTCLLAAVSATAFAAGSGRLVISPFQPAIPFGTAIKMTPDPSSIWSWYDEFKVSTNTSIPIQVDVDGNGQLDTRNPFVRVLITDMKVKVSVSPLTRVAISDGQGVLWDLTPLYDSSNNAVADPAYHLTTPLVLPVDSVPTVILEPRSSGSVSDVRLSLIGRVVNL